ncbi:RNase adapter RapZ [Thiomonas sp. FB-Cd]|uniref:RNase adapter RapZ n=1 Tax=Thiomonas sp. FB-Cd TaxID=1158292 RepID=UPI000B1FF076|nr:RNase adapter RapZ [Thiomonas sp. FB-Cd]
MNRPPAPDWPAHLRVVLLSGVSGSGKSIALNALEDAGYYCVDNLPPQLVDELLKAATEAGHTRVAIAMDVRSVESLGLLPELAQRLRSRCDLHFIYLDCGTDTLVQRFSETRRAHPLTARGVKSLAPDQPLPVSAPALIEAIELERELLAPVARLGLHIDTSGLRPAQLRAWVRQAVGVGAAQLTLLFESFAFKRGVALDADFVFDVRMLPNPHYDPLLRGMTGRDEPVAAFLRTQASVMRMLGDISTFLDTWLPAMAEDQRSYVVVAIGCTGGQHRSVFLTEELGRYFGRRYSVLVRHRELDAGATIGTIQLPGGAT